MSPHSIPDSGMGMRHLYTSGNVGTKEMKYIDNSPDFEKPEQSHDQSHDQSCDAAGGASGGNEDGADKLLNNLREVLTFPIMSS